MEITLTCSRYIAVAFLAPATQAVADKTCSDAEKIVQHLSDHQLLEYAVVNLTNHPDYLEDDAAVAVHQDFGEFVAKLQRNEGCYGSLLLSTWIESLDWPTKLALGGDKKVARHCLQCCLVTAALKGRTKVVRILLALGADINTGVSHDGAPLQAAARQGDARTVSVLLQAGANVDKPGGHYGSALQAASALGHVEVVSLLVNAGANINAQGGHYGNALHAASATGKNDIVQLLVDRRAEVDAIGDRENTALQAASAEGHTRVAEILINAKAKVNIKGGRYGSALHAACERGHKDIVRLLLGNGADINLTSDRRTPLQVALLNGYRGIASLLRGDAAGTDDDGKTSSAARVSSPRNDNRRPPPLASGRVLVNRDTLTVDPKGSLPRCSCAPGVYGPQLSLGRQGSGARGCQHCSSSGRMGWEDGNGWGHRQLEDQNATAGYYYTGKPKGEIERNSLPSQQTRQIRAGRETRTPRQVMWP
jgi:ankyrin repeat protein